MSEIVVSDRNWFKANPKANFRLREPAAGEVNEIAIDVDPRIGPLVGAGLDMAKVPDGMAWRVAAIKLDTNKSARMLVLHREGEGEEDVYGFRCSLVALGDRVAIKTL